MPYALREFECIDCHGTARRRLPAGSEARCVPCAVEHSAENARQIAAKSGPLYERWLWGTVTWARSRQADISVTKRKVAC